MSRKEVQELSDQKLIQKAKEISAVFKTGAQKHFDRKTYNVFFADFINVTRELKIRKLSVYG